jgi:AhpD family alkylhydroperoxidase
MRIVFAHFFVALAFGNAGFVLSQDSPEGIRPTPLTRPEMKRLLEDVKVRVPRIPLPELSDSDREKLGLQADSYESRVKYHYLNGMDGSRSGSSNAATPNVRGSQENAAKANANSIQAHGQSRDRSLSSSRQQDPLFTLDNALKVELFWIVSRVNNCQYCIGHQESKLLGLGRTEDQIALLDYNWEKSDIASQTAFAFAKKFTLEPHRFSDGDITGLKEHFTEDQILEMVLSMAGNNSINRWKEAIAVPQNKDGGGYSRVGSASSAGQAEPASDPLRPRGSYLTPTSTAFESTISSIVVQSDKSETPNTCATVSRRPALESRDFVEKSLLECATRKPRIPLMNDSKSRENIPGAASLSGELPNWVRLLARFPTAGSSRFDTIQASEGNGDISPLLKAQLSWILARQDRAWYALGRARDQLIGLNQNTEQIFALDGDWSSFSAREQVLFRLAKNLGNAPVVLSASEVKQAVDIVGPRDVVQVISFTTTQAAFNRITEALGLPLDPTGRAKNVDPIPVTRDDVKRVLDESKLAQSRLPAPPLTEAEEKLIAYQKETARTTGEQPRRFGLVNNARTRAYYLAEYGFTIDADIEKSKVSTNRDSDSGLDPSFRTMLFWIVSRGNNCTYCLGHQESGLANRGVPDEVLAALDSDWNAFEPAQKAAFEFVRDLSFAPYKVGASNIADLRVHYNDSQVAELIVTIAGFNSTNRWTGPMRIRQDVLFEFTRPTTPKFVNSFSLVAPAKRTATSGLIKAEYRVRPELESWQTVQEQLTAAKSRAPRLTLADATQTKTILSDKEFPLALANQQWVRFLATLPKSGVDRIVSYQKAIERGTLDNRSKAIIAYVAARQDRAWYALGHAIERLKQLGLSESEIQSFDSPSTAKTKPDSVLVRFAKIISADPAMISDEDFRDMQSFLDDKRVAEAVYQISQAAFFNRITEAAGLTLE